MSAPGRRYDWLHDWLYDCLGKITRHRGSVRRALSAAEVAAANLSNVRSWGFLISRRWVVFALVVALLAYLAWWLGQWQFSRLDDRQQRNAVFTTNVAADPIPAAEVLSSQREVPPRLEWRRISARGSYDPERTVIVRYQTREGSSGVDVVVPLLLPDGTAVAVDRGWLPTANNGTSVAEVPPPPTGEVEITGWVRRNAIGDSTTVTADSADALASTRAISSVTISERIGLDLLNGFVELESETPTPAEPLLAVELPETGNGPHFFYGLQWWFFGVLAVGGFGYLVYDERRGPRRASPRRNRERKHENTTGGPTA